MVNNGRLDRSCNNDTPYYLSTLFVFMQTFSYRAYSVTFMGTKKGGRLAPENVYLVISYEIPPTPSNKADLTFWHLIISNTNSLLKIESSI